MLRKLAGLFDRKSRVPAASVEDIRAWYHRPRTPTMSGERAMELYLTFHPRTAFLKTLPANASLVDIGAGDGSLSVFRGWPTPERHDLRMYAYSIEKGERFDDFDGYEISDWNLAPPEFDGNLFDAILCAHFIEHIAEPASFLDWAQRKLVPGGRAYVEWPAPASLRLPAKEALAAADVPLIISHFHDDDTHRDLPDIDAIAKGFRSRGFTIEARGIVRVPFLEDELMASYRDDANRFPSQAAFWSWTGWSQYLVVTRGA